MAAATDPAEHVDRILLLVMRVETWNQRNKAALILLG
jgi:hypothetical protein